MIITKKWTEFSIKIFYAKKSPLMWLLIFLAYLHAPVLRSRTLGPYALLRRATKAQACHEKSVTTQKGA